MDANKTVERDEEDHLGAVEGDRPDDRPNEGNRNAPALDAEGLPDDCDKIAADRLGATLDETQG